MFDKIRDYEILIRTVDCKYQGSLSHFPINLLHLENICKVLDFIYNEERKNIFIDKNDISEIYQKRFGFLSRITSFIIYICEIEKIVKNIFEDMIDFIKEHDEDVYLRLDLSEIKKDKAKREEEIKNYKFYRNKIFAHTSYTTEDILPNGLCKSCEFKISAKLKEKKDSINLKLTSLAYFSGSLIGIGEKSYCIGGDIIKVDEINNKTEEKLIEQKLDILENYKNIVEHFNDWENMFVIVMKVFIEKYPNKIRDLSNN